MIDVYYGAARTEALGTRRKDVFLIGGGNSDGHAAMLYASYATVSRSRASAPRD